ncbi:hypothetical protein ABDE40_001380 [Neisseria gonorrhoeae]
MNNLWEISYLYRGISCQQDEQNNGQLKPKGN